MSTPLVQNLVSTLTGVGFTRFAIALGPDPSKQALAVLEHPASGIRGGLTTDVWVDIHGDTDKETAPYVFGTQGEIDTKDLAALQAEEREHYNKPWGNIHDTLSNNLKIITLRIDSSQAEENLKAATKEILAEPLGASEWTVALPALHLSALTVSMVIFSCIHEVWEDEDRTDPDLIYLRIHKSPTQFDSALQGLKDIFGSGNVTEHGPSSHK